MRKAADPKPGRGIYKNGSVYWFACQRNKKRIFVSLQTKDYITALKKAAVIRQQPELNQGHLVEGAIGRFITYKVQQGEYSRFSAQNKRSTLQIFSDFIGEKEPSAVDPRHIQNFYDWVRKEKEKPVTESTAHSYLMTIRSFFQWCLSVDKSVRFNPCLEVRTGKITSPGRKKFCDAPLRNKLIDECPRQDLKFVLYCGFHAGMRRNEITEARPEWFDVDKRMIHITKLTPKIAEERGLDPFDLKDREERSLPMTSEFAAFLKAYPSDGAYCLAPERRRKANRYRYEFHRAFVTYMKEKGCPWVTIHTMRHTFASLLASEGVSIAMVSNWLGDDIRTTTRHYAHFLPKHDEIEKAFQRPKAKKRKQRKPKN